VTSNGKTPASSPTDQGSDNPRGPRTAGARFFKAVRRVATVFGVVLVLLGGYLYFYASRQQGYLTGRNLRVLSSMSTQIGTSLQSADQVLRQVDTTLNSGVAEWGAAAPFVPLYNDLVLRTSRRKGKRIEFVGDRAGLCSAIRQRSVQHDTGQQSLAGWRNDPDRLPHCLYRQFAITRSSSKRTKPDSALAIINMAEYLGPILSRSAFHKTALADDHGRVLLQAGESDIALTSLAAIVGSSNGDSSSSWNDLRLKPSITDVRLAGKTYRLFLEPCCLSPEGLYWDRHLVVAGLVAKETLVRESLRISLSIVMLCCAILLLVFLGWPFLKLRLIGEREPVLMRDGLLLGAGSLLAVAMSTIFVLDLYSYTKFRDDRDEELRALSSEIITNLKREVAAAYWQLDTLAAVELPRVKAEPPRDSLIPIRKDALQFPFFESWSVLDKEGTQALKWSTDAYIQPRIKVKDRAYFSEVARGQGWPGPPRSDELVASHAAAGKARAYYLEPTVSRTTGKRQVSLSVDLADDSTPVATMALEMVSLIGVVLPPGYGFAVLDSAGRVLLHSDPNRNLDERFFSETDQNRQLISAIAARTADTLSLKYGGADYRAYVTPVLELPWSLVTFLDKQPGRINNAEWLGTSVYMTLIYALILGIFIGLTLLFFPGYRAPWIWPDRRLRDGYRRVVAINGLFLLAMILAVTQLDGDDLLVAGFVLPLEAMIAAWACLANHRHVPEWISTTARSAVTLSLLVFLLLVFRRSEALGWSHGAILLLAAAGSGLALLPRRWLEPMQEGKPASSPRSIEGTYIGAAALFLLVAGVMPAAAFFKIARTAHTEMLVKRGQLRLAGGVEDRKKRVESLYSNALGAGRTSARKDRLCRRHHEQWQPDLCELDLYYRFYFGTEMQRVAADSARARVASTNLVRLALVPYRPQASVEWRSMLPRSAYDNSWSWTPRKNRLEFHGSRLSGGPTVSLSSVVPGFWPKRLSETLSAALFIIAILILTGGIARFLARRFFLIDVTDPVLVSRSGRVASLGGTNLFVICRNDLEQRSFETYPESQVIDLAKDKFEQSQDLRSLLDRVGKSEPVVVRHFEYRYDDVNATRAKLGLLDALVSECGSGVVVVSVRGLDGAPLGLREARRLAAAPSTEKKPGDSVLDSLVLVDVSRWEEGWTSRDRRCVPEGSTSASAVALIQAESRCDAHLGRVWKGLEESLKQMPPERAEPSREELLDMLGERAEPYFRAVWDSCQTGERVVLVHLAMHGLVNDKDRRVLRRLLARGLVRRRPHFTIMNETFRRYLLGRSAEVESDIPSGAESPWGSVRRPVLAVVASLAILLFVTQQELFSATSAIITALATGVASFSRISGLFESRRGSDSGGAV
jgi:hypothetical protein